MEKLFTYVTIFLSVFCFGILKSQSISLQTITSAAVKFSQSNGSISLTVGELIVFSEADSEGNSLGNGFTSATTSTTPGTPNSLNENQISNSGIIISPNPSNGLYTLSKNNSNFKSNLDIYITNTLGEVIHHFEWNLINSTFNFDLSNYSNGLYFVTLQGKDSTEKLKIVKQ